MSKVKKEKFIISVFSINRPGIIQRVVSTFTKRHTNIDSLTTSESSMPDVHRFTIIVQEELDEVRKIVASLDKQVDILKAFFYSPEEVVMQEIALYKVPTSVFLNSNRVETIVRKHNATILQIESDYTVIQKAGHQSQTKDLFAELKEIGIFEFVRSGVVAVPKEVEPLNKYLEHKENNTL